MKLRQTNDELPNMVAEQIYAPSEIQEPGNHLACTLTAPAAPCNNPKSTSSALCLLMGLWMFQME